MKKPLHLSKLILSCVFFMATAVCSMAALPYGTVEGFDSFPAGAITSGTTAYGTFSAASGHAEIFTGRYISGTKCLHVKGGGDKVVRQAKITFPEATDETLYLKFRAERFTKDGTFSFRVYALDEGGNETLITNGDSTSLSGSEWLPTRLKGEIPSGSTGLVFKVTAYLDKGALIEDVVISDVDPASVLEVTTGVWPVMKRLDGNGILRIEGLPASTVSNVKVHLDFSGTTNLDDIKGVCIRSGGTDGVYKGGSPQCYPVYSNVVPASETTVVTMTAGSASLSPAWVSVELKPNAGIDGKICCRLVKVEEGEKIHLPSTNVTSTQRLGVAVAKGRDLVYGKASPRGKVSNNYRIPGIVRAQNGDLVAVFDARYNGGGDLPGVIHVVCSRSTDGGKTWSPINIAMNYTGTKGNSVPTSNVDYSSSYGVGDPCILLDEVTGYLWVAGFARYGIWSSNAGFTDDKTSQYVIACSTDNGKTWGEAISLNFQCKDYAWRSIFQGPGHGITMKDRGDGVRAIIFPSQIWDGSNFPRSCMVYSLDHGKTWQCNEQGKSVPGIPSRTSEAIVSQLSDGTLMLNCRNENGGKRRTVYTTNDMGVTWKAHSTNNSALIEPTCQGSQLAVENVGDIDHLLLFSNPDNTGARNKMTLKVSYDDGMTWPDDKKVLYDQRTCAGYSDICMADDNNVGVFYEAMGGSECIFFLKIPIAEMLPVLQVTAGADRSASSLSADEGCDEENDGEEAEIAEFNRPSTPDASPQEAADPEPAATPEEEQGAPDPTDGTADTPDSSPNADPSDSDAAQAADPGEEDPQAQSTESIAEAMTFENESLQKLLGNSNPALTITPDSDKVIETIHIKSDSTWMLTSNVAWIKPYQMVGKGNKSVKVAIYANPRPIARSGLLMLKVAGRVPLYIRIDQPAAHSS